MVYNTVNKKTEIDLYIDIDFYNMLRESSKSNFQNFIYYAFCIVFKGYIFFLLTAKTGKRECSL